MTKFSLLGAAAVVATALASPAMAQEVIYNPGYCAQFYPNANCQNKGPGNPYTDGYQRYGAYRYGAQNNGWYDNWNGNSFAAPSYTRRYSGNAYGYEPGFAHSDYNANAHAGQGWNGIYDNRDNNSYAALNGFVCTPGTYFRGEDGLRHRCQ
jgi:hypothetical protein